MERRGDEISHVPPDGEGGRKVYRLAKSGLWLEGGTLGFRHGEYLVADHALDDLREVVLRYGRDSSDWITFLVFFVLIGGFGAGLYFWAWRAGSILGWILCGLGAFVSLLILAAGFGIKSRWLVLKGKAGEVVYPLQEDAAIVEAFFAEMREHAKAAQLPTKFLIEK